MTRKDITPEAVAREWLVGSSILVIATRLQVTTELIRRRLRVAKRDLPHLDWENRGPIKDTNSPAAYVKLNDGKPGESVLRQGSIVRGQRRFK